MKKRNPWLMMLIVVLVMAVLACTCTSSLPGGNNDANSGNSGDTGNSGDSGDSGDSSDGSSADMIRGLPVLGDAANKFDAEVGGTATVSYSTQTPINDVVSFYKTELGNMGYTVSLEAVQEASNTAGLTFDGEKTIVLGIAPDALNQGSLTVSITATPK